MTNNYYLEHHGIRGMKWGERRFQYDDGSLTPAGRDRYGVGEARKKTPFARIILSRKKNVVDTDADNLAGNNKQPKVSGPRHRGNGQEEPKRPLTDEERTALVRSGDVNKILSRADELSPQEMTSAIQRARDIDSLKQFSDKEEQRKQTLLDRAKGIKDKIDEANRQKILRSGNVNDILANADKFSNNELNDALTRAKYTSALKEQAKLEAHSKLKSIMNFATNAVGYIEKAQDIKKRMSALFSEDDDASFINLSPEDAMSQMGSWSKDKLKAFKERTDLFKNIGDNLKGALDRNKPKYDLANKTEDELMERFNASNDPNERSAINTLLKQKKENKANIKDINGIPSGNQQKQKQQQDNQNGQNGKQKKQDDDEKKQFRDNVESSLKDKILKSGKLKAILDNADMFSTKEIEDAMSRDKTLGNLKDKVKSELEKAKAEAEAKQKADPKYRAQEEARQEAKIRAAYDAKVNAMVAEQEAKLRSAVDSAVKYSKEDRDAKAAYSKIEDSWSNVRSKEALKNSNSKEAKKEYQKSMSDFANTLANVANDIKEENEHKSEMAAYYRQQTNKLLFGNLGDQRLSWDSDEDHDFKF